MKTSLLTTAALFIATSAAAQDFSLSRGAVTGASQSPALIQRHASTFEEGVLRGWADLWRAAGSFNYDSSLAAINQQEAYSRHLENKQKYAETYFNMRNLNREYRDAARRPRPTMSELKQYARDAAPERLSAYELQPETGQVAWPAALQGPQYAEQRSAIESAFAQRSVLNSGIGSSSQQVVTSQSASMQAQLKSELHEMPPMEYVAAKKFLTSLSYEAQQPLQLDGLASNN